MSISQLKDSLKEYAKDIKLNLSSVLTEEGSLGLTQRQIDGIALASAYATKNPSLITALQSEYDGKLSAEEIEAAKAAATIMGMNNIYYRFSHMTKDEEYRKMRANLRMNVIAQPGIDKLDFELMALAVSVINGCDMCINAHINAVTKAGISKEGVQSTARIASVLHAVSQALVIG